ncbi:MAG TPA: DUF72 domain-containing protein [bacterium]|nr:DUF72 domain-containing protein [bacterium]
MAKIYLGTSGWAYKEWGKLFFPKELPQSEHLSYLARHFNSVEINATFYRLQPPKNFETWRKKTPRGFRFSVKVSRYITHIERMKEVRAAWKRFLKTTLPLKEKMGVFLLQFPEFFHGSPDTEKRFADFFKAAAKDGKYRKAVEFRHESCFTDSMRAILEDYGVGTVIANSSKYPTAPWEPTADFVYFRLHGPRRMFGSSYSDRQLEVWAKKMRAFLKQGKDVYVYFNNDMHANAAANAQVLQKMLGGKKVFAA